MIVIKCLTFLIVFCRIFPSSGIPSDIVGFQGSHRDIAVDLFNTIGLRLVTSLNNISFLGVIIAIITLAILYNHRLKKKVDARIAELKLEVDQKNRALERAEVSDRLKTSFLNNISHEIRTPMNGIVGFSALLRDKDLAYDQIEQYTSIIDSSATQLLSIVDNVLEMALIESKQIKISIKRVDLHTLLDSIYESFKDEAKGKGIKLKLITPDVKNKYLLTDQVKLAQIITHLVNNAIKFTDNGEIIFGYENTGEFLEFFVKDTGIGVPRSMHSRIYDRFYKIDSSASQLYPGSGLGLPISRAFVEMLGGEIWSESVMPSGLALYFTHPVNEKSDITGTGELLPEKSDSPEDFNFSDITILIAEDDMYNMLYLQETLSFTKAKILTAKNGKEAVDMIMLNNEIKIALLDLKMPVMDGLEAARTIRKDFPVLPLIAQTAYAQVHEKEIAFKAGFNGHISKPIDRIKLFRLIKKHLN